MALDGVKRILSGSSSKGSIGCVTSESSDELEFEIREGLSKSTAAMLRCTACEATPGGALRDKPCCGKSHWGSTPDTRQRQLREVNPIGMNIIPA